MVKTVMERIYGMCRVSIAPLRTEPSDKAEICSQLLFGDHLEILEKAEKWWQIRNAYDDYIGWLDFRQLTALSLAQYVKSHDAEYMTPLVADATILAADGSTYHLAAGSTLPAYKDGFCAVGGEKFQVLFEPLRVEPFQTGDSQEPKEGWMPVEPAAEVAGEMIKTALFFQNAPYLWGGRTLFGIDCSGFSQVVYKMSGIKLPRDAWQQAELGRTVASLAEANTGDLAFFDNGSGRITHVGILLNNKEIIHASAKVRIDGIDSQGIYNSELGGHSHKLRMIKRYF
jgi:cell wall-associated NlpC family hydrolase